MKKMYFLAGLLSVQLAFAQNNENFKFEEVNDHGLPAFYGGSMVDREVDGKKAILITGMINNKPITQLYQYNGTKFELNPSTFTGVRGGQGIFLDIDKDGDQDIAIIGLGDNGTRHFLIYENQGGGTFVQKQDLSTYALSNASIDAGDYNKDGYPDVIVTGESSGSKKTYLFHNDSGNLTQKTASFTNVTQGSAKFIDLKGDGKLGVVLSGKKDNYGTVEIYEQTNDGNFHRIQDYYNSDYGYENADIAVGKINSDDYPDFVPVGSGYYGKGLVFYGQNGTNFTTDYELPNFSGSNSKNTVVLKDFNNDNLLDLVILGQPRDEKYRLYFYNNKGISNFEEVTNGPNINFGQDGSIVALDFDGDGLMDLIVTGQENGGSNSVIKVYKNTNTSLSNKETNVANNINIYPNPTSDSFKIQGNENIAQVEVYEVSGRLIKTFVSSEQYNIASLAKGTYIVVTKDKQGKKSTFKLLKK